MKLKLSHRNLIFLAVMVLIELFLVATGLWLAQQSERSLRAEQHALEVVSSVIVMEKSIDEFFRELRGKVVEANGNYQASCQYAVEINRQINNIQTLILSDDPEEAKTLNDIKTAFVEGTQIREELHRVDSPSNLGDQRETDLRTSFRAPMAKVSGEITSLLNRLRDSYTNRGKHEWAALNWFQILLKLLIAVSSVLHVLIALLLTLYFNRVIIARLSTIADNSKKLISGIELNPKVVGSDEISDLDKAFHSMAERLHETLRRERATSENAMDLICSINSREQFASVNRAAHSILGYYPEELLGQWFMDLIVLEDREKTRTFFLDMVSRGMKQPLENKLIKKGGAQIDTIWSAYWSKQDQMMFCVVHDISERKMVERALQASEQKIRTIIEHQPVGVITVDGAGRIESVNPRVGELFLCNPDQLIGTSADSLFPPNEKHGSNFLETVTKLELGQSIEWEAPRQNCQPVIVELTTNSVQLADGERILISLQDITQRREIERLKEEFIAMISHDLRTPLASIRATLELFELGAVDPNSDTGASRITDAKRNADRLIKLIGDLLDIEKMEAGKLTVTATPINVGEVIDSSIESVRAFANSMGVDIQSSADDIMVSGDEFRLVQVLVNLLSNAIKFSPSGSTVSIDCVTDKQWCEVQVKDCGPGIPKEMTESIFQKFKQVSDKVDKKQLAGTGLGLAICKAIIDSHEGTIGVRSELGHGSIFWFRVPLA